MKRGSDIFVRLVVAGGMTFGGVAMASAAATTAPQGAANPVDEASRPKPPLRLEDQQRRQVVRAVESLHRMQAPPAGFQVAVGSAVPSQKKLHLHPLPRPLIYQIPALRRYDYAALTHNVLIVDPMTRKVVEVIPR